MNYTITVSETELDVVRLALGRMVEPKPVHERRAAAPKRRPIYPAKPPRLSAARFTDVTERWARACADPMRWRLELAASVASGGRMGTGHTGALDVFRAWGLDPETGL